MSRESIVLTFGTFDLLHDGHIFLLEEAKRLGNKLIVCVASDKSVELLKNRTPVNSALNRIKKLEELGIADLVIEGDQDLGKWSVVVEHKPDIVAIGWDQENLKSALGADKEKLGVNFTMVDIDRHKS